MKISIYYSDQAPSARLGIVFDEPDMKWLWPKRPLRPRRVYIETVGEEVHVRAQSDEDTTGRAKRARYSSVSVRRPKGSKSDMKNTRWCSSITIMPTIPGLVVDRKFAGTAVNVKHVTTVQGRACAILIRDIQRLCSKSDHHVRAFEPLYNEERAAEVAPVRHIEPPVKTVKPPLENGWQTKVRDAVRTLNGLVDDHRDLELVLKEDGHVQARMLTIVEID